MEYKKSCLKVIKVVFLSLFFISGSLTNLHALQKVEAPWQLNYSKLMKEDIDYFLVDAQQSDEEHVQQLADWVAKCLPKINKDIFRYLLDNKIFTVAFLENNAVKCNNVVKHGDPFYATSSRLALINEALVRYIADISPDMSEDTFTQLISRKPGLIDELIPAILNNLGFIRNTNIINVLFRKRPQLVQLFIEKTLQNIEEVSWPILMTLLRKDPNLFDQYCAAIQAFTPVVDQDSLLSEIITLEDKTNTKEFRKSILPYLLKMNNTELSQTEAHLWEHCEKKHGTLQSNGEVDYSNPKLKKMAEYVIELEKQEQAKGRYTFVHGQPWKFDLLQDLYTRLWEIKTGQKIDSKHPYQFMRFFTQPTEKILKQHDNKRQKLLPDGHISRWYHASRFYDSTFLAFMNYALFVNHWRGNTAQYVKDGQASGLVLCRKINLVTVFQALGYDYLHSYYQRELRELEALHAQANEHGNGLLLSFTPERLKKCVYATSDEGYRRSVKIKGIGETKDVQIILDILRTAPWKLENSDSMAFAVILTQDCALKPNNGLDIYTFNAADPQKYAQYEKARDELLEKIVQNLAAEKWKYLKNKMASIKYWMERKNEEWFIDPYRFDSF